MYSGVLIFKFSLCTIRSVKNTLDHKQILREELTKRMAANPQYSLRAFARDLKLSPQQLSNLLNGRRGISPQAAQKIANRLGMNQRESERFFHMVQSRFGRSRLAKANSVARLKEFQSEQNRTAALTADAFQLISNWYHYALLELIKTQTNKSQSISFFSKRLGISQQEVEVALARLERLELVSKSGKDYRVNQDTLLSTDGVPSEALRSFHRQVLEKAIAAIALQTVQERILNTTFMNICRDDLPLAHSLIQNFWKSFTQQISRPTENGDVYALGIQFFNLTPTAGNAENK